MWKKNHWLWTVFVVNLGLLHTPVTAVTYDLEELCQRNEVWPTFRRAERGRVRFSTRRRFGSLLEAKPGETLVVILGNEEPIASQTKRTSSIETFRNDSDYQTKNSEDSNMTNITPTMSSEDSAISSSASISSEDVKATVLNNEGLNTDSNSTADDTSDETTSKEQKNRTHTRFNWNLKLKKDFDCLFGIKSYLIGSNLTLEVEWWGVDDTECNNYMQIHRAYESFFVQLSTRGSYVIASPGFIPLHIRVSLCKKNNPDLGLVLVASSTASDAVPQSSASYIFSFVAPTILLLIIVGASMSCCCCASPWQRFRQWRSREEDEEDDVTPTTPTSVLHTPTSSRMLFTGLNLSPTSPHRDKPPTYDELFPAGGSQTSTKRVKPKRAATHAEEPPPAYENLSFEHEGPS